MGTWHRAAWTGVLMSFAALATAPVARADVHKDEKLGYAFNVPPRWDRVPVDAGGFLAAKFQSNREYEWLTTRPADLLGQSHSRYDAPNST